MDQQRKLKSGNNSWSIKLTVIFSGTGGSFAKSWHEEVFSDIDIDIDIDIRHRHRQTCNRRLTEGFFTKKAIFFVSTATQHVDDYQM